MPTDDREQQFDRALQRLLRDASPESHCPDAETLSAYHERSLPESQLSYWKEHIAACARCQEILALVEQSEEAHAEERQKQFADLRGVYEESSALAFLSAAAPQAAARQPDDVVVAARTRAAEPQKIAMRPRWRWLVPVGVLAACAIVAVGIREMQTRGDKEAAASLQVARNEAVAPRPPSPVTPPATPVQPKEQPAKEETSDQKALDKALRDQTANDRVSVAPVLHESIRAKSSPASSNAPALSQNGDDLTSAARMAAPPALEPSDREEKDIARGAAVPAPQAPAPSSRTEAFAKKSAPEQRQKSIGPSAAQNLQVPSQVTAATAGESQLATRRAEMADFLAIAASERRYIVSPDAKTVWRVGDGGLIERSDDLGKTWKLQNSGVTQSLTTGSATSDKVGWVIGKNGTILLSTDGGKHWKQILSPIAGDIGGIHATDALQASIWDVPNRVRFETRDGGATWTRIANE